jgi:hypothetical protein
MPAWRCCAEGRLTLYSLCLENVMRPGPDQRTRAAYACICMLAVGLLYAPTAAVAWTARGRACCAADHCPVPEHHHSKAPARSEMPMDCGHDMSGMGACSMSCCHDSGRQLVTPMAFVLPSIASFSAPDAVITDVEMASPIETPKAFEPLSPPPRLTASVL